MECHHGSSTWLRIRRILVLEAGGWTRELLAAAAVAAAPDAEKHAVAG
eukprot:gene16847-4620_t